MNYDIFEEAKQILVENDFVIRVSKNENGLSVSYPPNILNRPHLNPLVISYRFLDDEIYKASSDGSTSHIECPEYATRIIVLADILLECHHRNVKYELLYQDGNLDFILADIKSNMDKPQDTDKEEQLEDILVDMIINMEAPEEEDIVGIEEGYNVMCEILNAGGI